MLHLNRVSAALIIAAGALLPGGAVSIALIVRGWHYPTDTIGGFCTAVAVVLGSGLLIDHVARWRDQKLCL
jgi:undecaprenyl-diphosphatase